jgi:glutaredoxin
LALVLLLAAVYAVSQWWGARQQASLGERLGAAARPGDIQMLSSTTCGICTQARRWFETHGVAFDECFVEKNAACADRFAQLMAPGTPVIVVRGQAQLGFDPERIALRLAARPSSKPASP